MKYQDDNYYIDKVLSGDVSAYAMLVSKHKNLVFTIGLKVLNNREDAEEIAQDTFLKAFQSLRGFERKSKFSTWLYRIAYNAAVSKTRKKKLEFSGMEDHIINNYSVDEITENAGKLDQSVQLMLVEKAMQRLPGGDHLLMTLFYKQENSIEEISEITGLTVSNVKVKLHRIRKRLYEDVQTMMPKN
jgi:RNA polymerase sigma-70 factor, ECF subfamily